jgi:hypothetical protein
MSELESWLPTLTPPRGGIERLRRALAPEPARRPPAFAAPALALSAFLATLLGLLGLDSALRTQNQERALAGALATPLPDVPRIANGAAYAAPSASAGVDVYFVLRREAEQP